MELSIFTVYGRNVDYTYQPAITRFTQDGQIGEQNLGFRFNTSSGFRYYGKTKDPDTGNTVVGIRRPGLAQGSKMRANRSSTELILSEGAKAMREGGYPDATARDVLQFFMTKHGGTKGVDWNVYRTETGELVSDEDLGAFLAGEDVTSQESGNPVDDSEFVRRDEETGHYVCLACDVSMKMGWMGHRRSKKHLANVKRKQQELQPQDTFSTAVGAA